MYSHHRRLLLLRLLPPQTPSSSFLRFLSSSRNSSFESSDDFERRLFGSTDPSAASNSFYRKLDRIERAHNNSRSGRPFDASAGADGDLGGFDTLTDGMDEKLKRAATTTGFPDGSDESLDGDYMFRPDVTFLPGSEYSPEDLDLTKPGIQKGSQTTKEFQTTTKEVLKKADFRNVRFLSNFLTEAGIIIKRSQTKISAKAQRKVAREIKTARAFGLMPFTCMGTKPFIFGKSMKDEDEDYNFDYDQYENRSTPEAPPVQDPRDELI